MSDMFRIMVDNFARLPLLTNATTCSGKTYIVTGGNCGLGLETARHLVGAQSSRVIITVRDISKGEIAKKEIERTTGVKGVVEIWKLDLASFKSVKQFATKAQRDLERIDGLIENAGLFLDSWTVAEGMETTMTVNVVSTMLLGELLMPKMIETARTYGTTPRLVFVTSPLGFLSGAKNELDKAGKDNILEGLDNPKFQDMDQRYSLTKLVEMYATRAMAEKYPVEETNVIINMINPGFCATALGRDARGLIRVLLAILRVAWGRTAEKGSRPILHGAVADTATHGKHLSACQIKDDWVKSWMTDSDGQRIQKQLWQELSAIIENAKVGRTTEL